MNKIIKHKILAGAMLFGFMLAGSSCEDNEGIRVTPEVPFADKTLYEVIINDSELSDFVRVLDSCDLKYPREENSHPLADSLFNHSRVYTVWAPVNGSFDADAVIAEMGAEKENRDLVFRSFIEAHIANHLVPANGTLDSDNLVLMLNDKKVSFTGDYKNGYEFSGIKLSDKDKNIRVKNGILHKIASPSEYKYSIWEYLKVAENVDSVSKYLYSFNVTEFNPGLSIQGPIVNSQPTYLDSVFTTTNDLLNSWSGVGNLDSEDSTYVVYVPSNAMWNEWIKKTEAYFNYDLSYSDDKLPKSVKTERDSLRRYYARFNHLKYMTYSMNEQKHLKTTDSMVPAYRSYRRPLFAKEDLEKHVIHELTKELSNGTFKVVDAMPYKPTDLWHDTIFLEGENTAMWTSSMPANVKVVSAYKSQLNDKDSTLLNAEVSGGNYLYYERKTEEGAYAYIKVPKVLSADYHVAVIIVPKNITDEYVKPETMSPGKLQFTITQAHGTGGSKELYNQAIVTNPVGMDTIYLTVDGQRDSDRAVITPLYAEYYNSTSEKDYNVTFTVESLISERDDHENGIEAFDCSIRIDKILFIPVPYSE